MSPEWMVAFDRQEAAMKERGRNSLSDPLEREEWRGLEWVNGLFTRLAGGQRRTARKTAQKLVIGWNFTPAAARRRSQAKALWGPVLHSLSHGQRSRRNCVKAAGSSAMQEPSNGL